MVSTDVWFICIWGEPTLKAMKDTSLKNGIGLVLVEPLIQGLNRSVESSSSVTIRTLEYMIPYYFKTKFNFDII